MRRNRFGRARVPYKSGAEKLCDRPLFRGTVDTALIAEQWDQLVRIAASLRDRTAPAHVVLQRLINASPADRVSKALTALGRACKTLFILRYIHEEPTRRAIQSQLNRGEPSRTDALLIGRISR